jgi:hypothetical protein
MSFWTFIKLLAALGVLAVMTFTGMLAYHTVVSPLGGLFEKIIPDPSEVVGRQPDLEFAKKLDSGVLPAVDPGEKAFQKAHELLALGDINEAREKLTAIVNVFPTSSRAPSARRIVGEMNLDEILLLQAFAIPVFVCCKGPCPAIHRVPSPNESNRRGHPKK